MDGMDKFHSDMAAINARVDQLIRERAEMARLLEKFQMVDSQDANDANDRVRMEFLRLCPEFIGYAKQARALLARIEGE